MCGAAEPRVIPSVARMMAGLALFIAQLAGSLAGEAANAPDLAISAHIEMKQVKIEQDGTASLELRADPGLAEPARIERSAPPGKRTYRNLVIDLTAEAWLTDPQAETDVKVQQGKPDNDRNP